MKKYSLLMCLADPSGSPRPSRMINLLDKLGYSVDVLGFKAKGKINVNNFFTIPEYNQNKIINVQRYFYRISSSILSRFGNAFKNLSIYFNNKSYRFESLYNIQFKKNYNLIVVEDLYLLPFALSVCDKAKILFDAREYYPRQHEDSLIFRFINKPIVLMICKKYLDKCDYLLTVSNGLQAAYLADFGVNMTVLRSVPNYKEMTIKKTSKDIIRMVHHGVANKNRNLENMIKIVQNLDQRFTLDFYLVGNLSHVEKLKKAAAGCERINFLEPVSYEGIIPMLNNYDIGFYYLEPNGFNVTYCLPNKFFEFIQARLAIFVGPSPDMSELVNEFDCGFVCDEFSIVSAVNTLKRLNSDQIDRARVNSDKASRVLCYEKESEKITKLLSLN